MLQKYKYLFALFYFSSVIWSSFYSQRVDYIYTNFNGYWNTSMTICSH